MTQNYELLYIISNKYAENQVEPIVNKIDEYLTKSGCQILKKEDLGKKRLAYPIKQSRFGYYILRQFSAAKETVRQINRFLTLSEEIIRQQIFKLEPIKIPKKTRIRVKKPVAIREPEKIKEEKAEEKIMKKETKIDLDNLDKKLDEILQEKII